MKLTTLTDPAVEKLKQNDLEAIKCGDCGAYWGVSYNETEEELFMFCSCENKAPEPVTEWVGRFMAENASGDNTGKAYQ